MLFDQNNSAINEIYSNTQSNGDKSINNNRKIICIPANLDYRSSVSQEGKIKKYLYRLIEIFISIFCLLSTFPIMLIIALIIKIDSPGPALFFQTRCSQSKRKFGKEIVRNNQLEINDKNFSYLKEYWVPGTFKFVKFRTMYADSKERFPELYNYNYSKKEIDRVAFKSENDPRVTKIGKWLRKSTLDELPNFWNVLTGDMRLVGPRPEIPEMLTNYRPEQMHKFTVKPGITGLPQINGRGRLSFQKTVSYDLEYVKNKSLLLDVKILALTIWRVLTKHGAF